jgi:hypothetical protein
MIRPNQLLQIFLFKRAIHSKRTIIETIHLTYDSTKSTIVNLPFEPSKILKRIPCENYAFALRYSIWSLTGNLFFKLSNIHEQNLTKNYLPDMCSSIKSRAVNLFYTESTIFKRFLAQSYSFLMRVSIIVALSQPLLQSNPYNRTEFLLCTFISYMISDILITIKVWL